MRLGFCSVYFDSLDKANSLIFWKQIVHLNFVFYISFLQLLLSSHLNKRYAEIILLSCDADSLPIFKHISNFL